LMRQFGSGFTLVGDFAQGSKQGRRHRLAGNISGSVHDDWQQRGSC
jgi:hypothetical protein